MGGIVARGCPSQHDASKLRAVILRDATASDLEAIRGLYNALLLTTTIGWTETEQPPEEREAWFARQTQQGYPVLVAEDGGTVVGYAAYGDFRGAGKWPGYRHTVEHTIHVREDRWGRGVGRALLAALIERALDAGVHVMVAAIDGGNDASIDFHRRLGFVEVARMPEVGRKFGRWLDLVLMQRVLDPGGTR
jgi:L-amino acid N-acyltransferase YncA